MRKLVLLCLIAMVFLIGACAEPNEGGVHESLWIAEHGEEVAEEGYSECVDCHGADLSGSGGVISCYSCHAFNTTPPFIVHPASWSNAYIDHRAYAASSDAECRGCHGADLKGTPAAPSCFSDSYNSQGCHEGGPGEVPHPIDGSYFDPALHGHDAKQDLTSCQACHGEAGGSGSNPRFNLGIDDVGGNGCESCHGINMAHPQDWAGANDTFHYSAGNIQGACTLCHGASLDGAGGVGPSCLQCHDDTTAFTLDCTACHAYPPDGTDYTIGAEVVTGVDHSSVPPGPHTGCTLCHGMSSDGSGGFDADSGYLLFDKATDTIGDHFDGNIQIRDLVQYDEDNHVCNTCHNNDPGHALSDSGLPVDTF